ncbi:MAG: AAA family ATPase [Candidatus Bathyarchaeia archaeon]
MASQELEQLGLKYATQAVQADGSGAKGIAISHYRRAIEILLKMCSLYPNAPQNRVYMERAEAYRKRVEELRSPQRDTGESATPGQGSVLEEVVLTDKPNVRWNDIGNLSVAKKAIQESIVYPMRRPDLFPLGWPTGILLFGPPGCGKTLLAAAVATEINAVFYSVDSASIMSKWLGESEKNVVHIFDNARKVAQNGQSAILFIDEVDSLVRAGRGDIGGEVRVRNQFLKEMDSVGGKNKKLMLYVIGATNKPWELDDPFIRRFQKRIHIPLPDGHARTDILKLYGKSLKLSNDVDLAALAKVTDAYSGSDIKDIVQAAQIKVVREYFEAQDSSGSDVEPRRVAMSDFMQVLQERKPSVSQEMLKTFARWETQFGAT